MNSLEKANSFYYYWEFHLCFLYSSRETGKTVPQDRMQWWKMQIWYVYPLGCNIQSLQALIRQTDPGYRRMDHERGKIPVVEYKAFAKTINPVITTGSLVEWLKMQAMKYIVKLRNTTMVSHCSIQKLLIGIWWMQHLW